MRFYPIDEAGSVAYRASFRECRLLRILAWLVSIYLVLLVVVVTGKGWLDLPGGDSIRGYLALGLLLLGAGSVALVLAKTLRPGNWLLRVLPRGILVHLAGPGARRGGPPAVLFLAWGEIEWAGPFADDRRGLCLRLVERDYRDLEDRIAEVGGEDAPVRLLQGRQLYIRWGGRRAWVRPAMDEAVEELSAGIEGEKAKPPARKVGRP